MPIKLIRIRISITIDCHYKQLAFVRSSWTFKYRKEDFESAKSRMYNINLSLFGH